MKEPKDPADLPKAWLAKLVRELQEWAYLDTDGDGMPEWNSDKEVGGADTVEVLCDLLKHFGLAPKPRSMKR